MYHPPSPGDVSWNYDITFDETGEWEYHPPSPGVSWNIEGVGQNIDVFKYHPLPRGVSCNTIIGTPSYCSIWDLTPFSRGVSWNAQDEEIAECGLVPPRRSALLNRVQSCLQPIDPIGKPLNL